MTEWGSYACGEGSLLAQMMRKVTLVTAVMKARKGNPGLEGGGSGTAGSGHGCTKSLRARRGGGRMWSGLLANPSLV